MLAALSWAVTSESASSTVPERTLEYMRALSRVPRFATLAMFLDEGEKRCVRDLWDAVAGAGVGGDLGDERKRWGC
jgi:hypothetical protein